MSRIGKAADKDAIAQLQKHLLRVLDKHEDECQICEAAWDYLDELERQE